MKLGVRMVYSKRMLIGGDIVSKHKIKLEFTIPDSGDRSYGVVRLTVGLGKYKRLLVGISAPRAKYSVCQTDKLFFAIR